MVAQESVGEGRRRSTEDRQEHGGIGTGERHEWIERFCDRLARIETGRDASRLLAREPPAAGSLAVFPMWCWLEPLIDVGRKARRRDGAVAHFPVRVVWLSGTVLVADGEIEAPWSLAGMGHTDAGIARLPEATGVPPGLAREIALAPRVTRRGLTTELERLVADGTAARWEVLMDLEPFVRREVVRAASALRYELAETRGHQAHARLSRVLDEEGVQRVVDRMVLGDGGFPGRVGPLVDRCLEAAAFLRVDPLRYVAKDIRRSAQEEVRKAIDDPRAGRRIRLLARTMRGATAEQIAQAYRVLHPYAPVSAALVTVALSTGPDPMADRLPLGHDGDPGAAA